MEQQSNEFDLVTEIHIRLIPGLPRWEVIVLESDGFFYPVDMYEDVPSAFEQARIINTRCKQPVTIKIIQENGDTAFMECTKFSKLEQLSMVRDSYIYFNERTNHWEVFLLNERSSFVISDIASEDDAVALAEFVRAINPECRIIRENLLAPPTIADNTCRARACIWNVNDSCLQMPRNSNLPLPAVDPSFETWTEHNHPTPRSCLHYSSNEEVANTE